MMEQAIKPNETVLRAETAALHAKFSIFCNTQGCTGRVVVTLERTMCEDSYYLTCSSCGTFEMISTVQTCSDEDM